MPYKLVAQFGQAMTVPESNGAAIELGECVRQWPSQVDYTLSQNGVREKVLASRPVRADAT